MDLGHLSSLALLASGAAGVAIPERVAEALELPAGTARGRAETRAGLGGTYAALGAFALLDGSAGSQRAIGATWLGAGVVRLATLKVDRPRTDAAYWVYLGLELGLGTTALLAARRRT
ncbi:MAG TPA: hypothetical protein VFE15_16475 [Marmoricola sp.]|nr:hypothetical protein [Marmoricola sp.]